MALVVTCSLSPRHRPFRAGRLCSVVCTAVAGGVGPAVALSSSHLPLLAAWGLKSTSRAVSGPPGSQGLMLGLSFPRADLQAEAPRAELQLWLPRSVAKLSAHARGRPHESASVCGLIRIHGGTLPAPEGLWVRKQAGQHPGVSNLGTFVAMRGGHFCPELTVHPVTFQEKLCFLCC